MKLFKNILYFFFPIFCKICLKEQEHTLCKDCKNKVQKATEFEIENIRVLPCFKYEEVSQKLILGLKYNGKIENVQIIAKLILEEKKSEFKNIDYIIPVGTSFIKRALKGFSTPALIANELNKTLNIKVLNNFFGKKFFGIKASQVGLSRFERLQNLKNAFWVKQKNLIKGKNIILIDDVITTGATINTCIKELLKENPKEIKIISFLHRNLS